MNSPSVIELDEKESILDYVYSNFDTEDSFGLTAKQLQLILENVRGNTLSLRQIEKSMNDICACGILCDREELLDVLKEMDRRYYLAQDLQWEFALLDRQRKGAISKSGIQFLFQMVYGQYFSKFKFDSMVQSRLVTKSDVTFDEVEVELCNVPTYEWIEQFRQEEDKEREEEMQKQKEFEKEQRKIEEEKAAKREEKRLREEAERMIEEEEEKKRLEVQRNKKEETEVKMEQGEVEEQKVEVKADDPPEKDIEAERKKAFEHWKRLQDSLKEKLHQQRILALQEAKAKYDKEEATKVLEKADAAMEAEIHAAQEVEKAQLAENEAETEDEKLKAIKAKQLAEQEALKQKEKRLKISLQSVIKLGSRPKIDATVVEAEEARIAALEPDIKTAKLVSDSILCGEKLENAMMKRSLSEIQTAVTEIKAKGYEKKHVVPLLEASKLTEKLKKLEKLRKEILALDQRTISEIRSYKTPIAAIHEVMIGTYIILGYKEKQLKEWKYIQALLGRSGKEGLKRMCTTLKASDIDLSLADMARKKYLQKHDVNTITGISAGAATFFVWSTAMIDEARSWHEDSEFRQRVEEKRKKQEEEVKLLQKSKNGKREIPAISNNTSNSSKSPGTRNSNPKSPASRKAVFKSPEIKKTRSPKVQRK